MNESPGLGLDAQMDVDCGCGNGMGMALGHDIDRGVSIWELAFAFWRYQLIELVGPNPSDRR